MSETMNMNYKQAIELLELENVFSMKELRKSYYKKCLLYHPDKNINGKVMFQKVNAAYQYLLHLSKYDDGASSTSTYDYETGEYTYMYTNMNDHKTASTNYIEMFKSYIRSMSPDVFQACDVERVIHIISNIITTLVHNNDDVALRIMDTLDEETCNRIYQYLHTYKNICGISPEFLIKMRELINMRFEELPTIVLKPRLCDLMNDTIFIYETEEVNEGENKKIKYYIPLWHHELYFKHHIIHIHPDISDTVVIDCDNNIIVNKYVDILDIIKTSNIEVLVGSKLFIIEREKISFIEYQRIVIPKSGIAKINEKEIYDASHKGDIIVNVHISFDTESNTNIEPNTDTDPITNIEPNTTNT